MYECCRELGLLCNLRPVCSFACVVVSGVDTSGVRCGEIFGLVEARIELVDRKTQN